MSRKKENVLNLYEIIKKHKENLKTYIINLNLNKISTILFKFLIDIYYILIFIIIILISPFLIFFFKHDVYDTNYSDDIKI